MEKYQEKFENKKIFIFDLDSTLAESKQPLSHVMMDTLRKLGSRVKVAVITGGSYEQLQKQFLKAFGSTDLSFLYIMPTNGNRLYVYEGGKWVKKYENNIDVHDREHIISILNFVAKSHQNMLGDKSFGPRIEDRMSQITFSALGQEAPVEAKSGWDRDMSKRRVIAEDLRRLLPNFAIGIGGMTSIDITALGSDKAAGVERLLTYLELSINDALYIGDALEDDGNDASVKRLGIDWIDVENPDHTTRILKSFLNL